MNENNKISDIIKTSLENIRTVVDANTIIGDPITPPSGVTILPVSEVSVGFASGGFDYLGKNASNAPKEKGNNFGGGGGSGLSVKPVAFLVISPEGNVDLLPISSNNSPSDISVIFDKAPSLIDKIKSLFSKKTDNGESEDKVDKASEKNDDEDIKKLFREELSAE